MCNHRVFLGLGSNLGDKQGNIEIAYSEIENRIGRIVSQSDFYITKPNGFDSENDFQNSVCEVKTELDPYKVFEEILYIEKYIGRTSKSINGKYSDRIIDIDILLYDDLVIDTEVLTIPHPRFHQRNFVLVPFVEISPNIIHPTLNKSISELNDELIND